MRGRRGVSPGVVAAPAILLSAAREPSAELRGCTGGRWPLGGGGQLPAGQGKRTGHKRCASPAAHRPASCAHHLPRHHRSPREEGETKFWVNFPIFFLIRKKKKNQKLGGRKNRNATFKKKNKKRREKKKKKHAEPGGAEGRRRGGRAGRGQPPPEKLRRGCTYLYCSR